MTKKQEIVPVNLQDERHSSRSSKGSPQKLVARWKQGEGECFIYEEIQDHTLRILLEGVISHEAR